MVVSRERLSVGTDWAETGRLGLRRRVVSETRTIQVTVHREELVVDGDDVAVHDGATTGTATDGPVTSGDASAPEPLVIVLREEVPRIQMELRAYERVTVHVNRVVSSVAVSGDVRHEEIAVDTTPVPGLR